MEVCVCSVSSCAPQVVGVKMVFCRLKNRVSEMSHKSPMSLGCWVQNRLPALPCGPARSLRGRGLPPVHGSTRVNHAADFRTMGPEVSTGPGLGPWSARGERSSWGKGQGLQCVAAISRSTETMGVGVPCRDVRCKEVCHKF